MREVPFVSFPNLKPTAYSAFKSQGEICIARAAIGKAIGLRVMRSDDPDKSERAPILFEGGEAGVQAFSSWCEQHREEFGTGFIGLSLVPHEQVVAAAEVRDE